MRWFLTKITWSFQGEIFAHKWLLLSTENFWHSKDRASAAVCMGGWRVRRMAVKSDSRTPHDQGLKSTQTKSRRFVLSHWKYQPAGFTVAGSLMILLLTPRSRGTHSAKDKPMVRLPELKIYQYRQLVLEPPPGIGTNHPILKNGEGEVIYEFFTSLINS